MSGQKNFQTQKGLLLLVLQIMGFNKQLIYFTRGKKSLKKKMVPKALVVMWGCSCLACVVGWRGKTWQKGDECVE